MTEAGSLLAPHPPLFIRALPLHGADIYPFPHARALLHDALDVAGGAERGGKRRQPQFPELAGCAAVITDAALIGDEAADAGGQSSVRERGGCRRRRRRGRQKGQLRWGRGRCGGGGEGNGRPPGGAGV